MVFPFKLRDPREFDSLKDGLGRAAEQKPESIPTYNPHGQRSQHVCGMASNTTV